MWRRPPPCWACRPAPSRVAPSMRCGGCATAWMRRTRRRESGVMDERDAPMGRTIDGRDRPERPAEDDELPPELRAVAARYAAQPVPRPTAEQTARLLSRLQAEQ